MSLTPVYSCCIRFDCFCVLDLKGLTTSQLSSRALAIIKEQAAIDSVCFPETMSKMLIVNSPMFFTATWSLIKGWLDPRTTGKIEVLSAKQTTNRLLELVEADQLPSDYGGTATETDKTIMQDFGGDLNRMTTKMLYLRGSGSETVEIKSGETMEVEVFTRSPAGAKFSLLDGKTTVGSGKEVKHSGTGKNDSEVPTSMTITDSPVTGPKTIKVSASSNGGRFSTHNFLIVFKFKNA